MLVGTTSRPATVTLTNPNASALKITSIATTKPYAVSNTTCGSQVTAGGNCQIVLTFEPTVAANPAGSSETGRLVVTDNATSSSQTASLSGVAFGVSISGIAIQNGMRAAAIKVVSVNPNGSDGTTLATAATDRSGHFSIIIADPQSGPVRFRASGGSYESEQDGATITTPSPISALLPSLQNNLPGLSINPLTTFVDSLAQGNISRGQSVATALSNSTASIEHCYGISTDPSTLTPLYTRAAPGTDAGRLGLILGALSNEDELACSNAPGGLVAALASDIYDGIFDGTKSGTAISYCGGTLTAIAGTAQFSDALSGLHGLKIATSGFTFGGIRNALSRNRMRAAKAAPDAATIEEALGAAAPRAIGILDPAQPSMKTGRSNATATLLPNGKVLIVGGDAVYGRILDSTELYDPVSNSFAASTPAMNAKRNGATTTLLPNGKVLIAGGADHIGGAATNVFSSTELYDPVSNTFAKSTPTMNAARLWATATRLPNGRVLIAGGQDSSDHPLKSTDLYDPVSNSFAATSPAMNVARRSATATLLPNGKVLIAGGGGDGEGALSSTELYDPVANSFAALTPSMNAARQLATATLLPNGKVLIAGGFNYYGPPGSNPLWFLSSAELYDPVSNTFAASTPAMNFRREDAAATLLPNGKVLIAGGYGPNGGYQNSTELYNPARNTFAASTPVMNDRRQNATSTLLPNGKVLIAGGYTGIDANTSAELYDPATNTFAAAPEMDPGR